MSNSVSRDSAPGRNAALGSAADGVMDKLLRAEIQRAGDSRLSCHLFEPETISAYVEQALFPSEAARIETHLADCQVCRKAVALLSKEAGIAVYGRLKSGAASDKQVPLVLWLQNSLRRPQLAIPGLAVIALLAVGPYLLLHGVLRGQRSQAARQRTDARETRGAEVSGPSEFARANPASPVDRAQASIAKAPETDGSIPDGLVANALDNEEAKAPGDQPGTSGRLAETAESETAESESESNRPGNATVAPAAAGAAPAVIGSAGKFDSDHAGSQQSSGRAGEAGLQKASGQPAAANTRNRDAASNEGAQSGQDSGQRQDVAQEDQHNLRPIDPQGALMVPQDEKAAEVSILKHGSIADQPNASRETNLAIKPQDSLAPPPASESDDAQGSRAIARPPMRTFKGESAPAKDAVRKAPVTAPSNKKQKIEREVEGKKFRLNGGVWSDTEYRAERDMPAVTLVRNSAVYKSVLEKQPGLKAYAEGFSSDEHAIIVYKKIVYKIVPARGSK